MPSAERVVLDAPPDVAVDAASPVASSVTGGDWLDKYRVVEQDLAPDARNLWVKAIRVADDTAVMMRKSSRVTAEARERVWQRLCGLACPGMQKPLEARATESERQEVWEAIAAPSLREWRNGMTAVDAAQVTRLVGQLADVLGALHGHGLGHFGLSPDTIFVRETAAGTELVVGGFDAATEIGQSGLVPIAVNALYAPPEAAGLFNHTPGSQLLAWDWWSIGRIAQELILGRHPAALIPDGAAAQLPAGLSARAEALLFERSVGSLHAGAVELMTDLDPSIELLLRGLLASAVDGRWRLAEVRDWLAGASPVERYGHSRKDRFFHLGGRSYSVPEAARLLQQPEYAADVLDQVFAVGRPDAFCRFLSESPGYKQAWERFTAVTALVEASALRRVREEIRREVVAAAALQELTGQEFQWRGRPLTAERLKEELADERKSPALQSELAVMATPVIIQHIRLHDPETARVVEQLVRTAGEVEELAFSQYWVDAADVAGRMRIWTLALEDGAVLAAAHRKLRAEYARTTDQGLEKIFATAQPSPPMLVTLAWVARDPGRYGFLTHEQVRKARVEELTQQARLLGGVIFWRQLERALRTGPLVFGRYWQVAVGGAGALLLVAVHLPGIPGIVAGLVPLAGFVGLCCLLNRVQAANVARWQPDVAAWRWLDDCRRCGREAEALATRHRLPANRPGAEAALERVEQELRGLLREGDRGMPARPPRQIGTWVASVGSWMAMLLLAAGSTWQGYRHPPSIADHVHSWQRLAGEARREQKVETKDIKVSWPYRAPLNEPMEIPTRGEFEPTGAQRRVARARGRQLVERYDPATIDGLIAIYVPIEGGVGGLLLFDGRKGEVLDHGGVMVDFVPFSNMWLKIGKQQALFIGK